MNQTLEHVKAGALTTEDLEGVGTLCQWLRTCSAEDLRWLEGDYVRQVAVIRAQLAAVREEIALRDAAAF